MIMILISIWMVEIKFHQYLTTVLTLTLLLLLIIIIFVMIMIIITIIIIIIWMVGTWRLSPPLELPVSFLLCFESSSLLYNCIVQSI